MPVGLSVSGDEAMRTKKYKTAEGFLESHYDHEFFYSQPERRGTREEKIQRSDVATRNAVRALLPAVGLGGAKIDDSENLKEAVARIQQTPEAQNDRVQHFLKGALKWLGRRRLIPISATMIETSSAP
jgi:hypothetical protein